MLKMIIYTCATLQDNFCYYPEISSRMIKIYIEKK